MHCRFYERVFPEQDKIVYCEIIKVDPQLGAYVALLEYDRKEGMLMASECSRKWIKLVSRLLKVNKWEALLVTKVDETDGFIDLSRKRVHPDDIKTCEEWYNKSLKVNNIAKQTAA